MRHGPRRSCNASECWAYIFKSQKAKFSNKNSIWIRWNSEVSVLLYHILVTSFLRIPVCINSYKFYYNTFLKSNSLNATGFSQQATDILLGIYKFTHIYRHNLPLSKSTTPISTKLHYSDTSVFKHWEYINAHTHAYIFNLGTSGPL